MSAHTLKRIENVLEKQFIELINMSDWIGRPDDQIRGAFLSRALAALCIKNLAGVDPEIAAASITDSYSDGGLDAVFFDAKTDALFLVQSKWSGSATKPLDEQGANKFVSGVRDLLAARFDVFNDKIRAKEAEIREILYSERPVRIRLVTAHTATQPTPPHVLRKIEDLVKELNDPVSVATSEDYAQAGVYELITSDSRDPKIKLQIVLNDWGMIDIPFLSYYGRVQVREIAEWWHAHQNRLFSQNLRLYYLNSDVNEALARTLSADPESFWYFNNGITIICDKVVKGLAGSPHHKFGIFSCEGVSIVNGAQTVGTIGTTFVSETDGNDLPGAAVDPVSWVQVRLISLEKCPPDFARILTRAANLQNAVGNREFAAMDPLQHRIATEFALDKRRYVYKSGETDPKGDEGCSIIEATQALGCAHSLTLAVQVKREIGAIWAKTDGAPYSEIFNDGVTSFHVWRSVLIMRAVDEELQKLRNSASPRADMVGVHMNRIILHLVFQDPAVRAKYKDPSANGDLVDAARVAVGPVFERVSDYIERQHPGEYLASLCKNLGKCEELAMAFEAPKAVEDSSGQGSLNLVVVREV